MTTWPHLASRHSLKRTFKPLDTIVASEDLFWIGGRASKVHLASTNIMHLLLTLLTTLATCAMITSSAPSAHEAENRELRLSSISRRELSNVRKNLAERAEEEYRILKGWRPAPSDNFPECYYVKCVPYMNVS